MPALGGCRAHETLILLLVILAQQSVVGASADEGPVSFSNKLPLRRAAVHWYCVENKQAARTVQTCSRHAGTVAATHSNLLRPYRRRRRTKVRHPASTMATRSECNRRHLRTLPHSPSVADRYGREDAQHAAGSDTGGAQACDGAARCVDFSTREKGANTPIQLLSWPPLTATVTARHRCPLTGEARREPGALRVLEDVPCLLWLHQAGERHRPVRRGGHTRHTHMIRTAG